jgi:phage-related holin
MGFHIHKELLRNAIFEQHFYQFFENISYKKSWMEIVQYIHLLVCIQVIYWININALTEHQLDPTYVQK